MVVRPRDRGHRGSCGHGRVGADAPAGHPGGARIRAARTRDNGYGAVRARDRCRRSGPDGTDGGRAAYPCHGRSRRRVQACRTSTATTGPGDTHRHRCLHRRDDRRLPGGDDPTPDACGTSTAGVVHAARSRTATRCRSNTVSARHGRISTAARDGQATDGRTLGKADHRIGAAVATEQRRQPCRRDRPVRGGVHAGRPGTAAIPRWSGAVGPPAGCSPLHGRPGFSDRAAAVRLDVTATACQRTHEPAVGAHGHPSVPAADRAGTVRRAAVHSSLAARDQRCENQ